MDAGLFGNITNPFASRTPASPFGRLLIRGPGGESPQPVPGAVDSTSLGAAAASPTRILDQEVLRALDEVLSSGGGAGLDRSASEDAYTPEQVAGRILDFVASAVGQETDPGRRGERLNQLREGIEKGFEDARAILDGLGVLTGDVATGIDRSYSLIQDGLDALASNAADPGGETPAAASNAAATQAGFIAASFSTVQSTSLVINTRDGDRVTIDITKQATASRTELAGTRGDTGFSSVQSRREASVDFSFSVEGNLDEDEQKAINALIKRIDKVSEKFFDGNVQAAFNKAAGLEFNGEELAGYSLNLNSSQTYRAVAAYQQSQPDTAAASAVGPGDAVALGGEVRGLIDTAAETTPLANPAQDVANIFTTMTRERASAFGPEVLGNDAMNLLQDLVGRIVDSYGAKRGVEDDEHHEQKDSAAEETAEHA